MYPLVDAGVALARVAPPLAYYAYIGSTVIQTLNLSPPDQAVTGDGSLCCLCCTFRLFSRHCYLETMADRLARGPKRQAAIALTNAELL